MLPVIAVALLLTTLRADERLDRAIVKLRQGDPSASTDLIQIGPSAVLAVTPFLRDLKIDVRREAVIVLGSLKGNESCQALAVPFNDDSPEIRDRAAAAYYQGCSRQTVPCAAVMQAVAKGAVSAATILLCGYCVEARQFLERPPGGKVKLEAWGPVVPVALVASVARLRLGDQSQSAIIAAAVKSRVRTETEFAVQVLAEIPEGNLSIMLPAYSDLRESTVLTHAPSGVRPRRICDAVADAMAARLGLKLIANRGPAGRYTRQELASAKAAAHAKMSGTP